MFDILVDIFADISDKIKFEMSQADNGDSKGTDILRNKKEYGNISEFATEV